LPPVGDSTVSRRDFLWRASQVSCALTVAAPGLGDALGRMLQHHGVASSARLGGYAAALGICVALELGAAALILLRPAAR